jgi:hypothetical protein
MTATGLLPIIDVYIQLPHQSQEERVVGEKWNISSGRTKIGGKIGDQEE